MYYIQYIFIVVFNRVDNSTKRTLRSLVDQGNELLYIAVFFPIFKLHFQDFVSIISYSSMLQTCSYIACNYLEIGKENTG